MKKASLFVTLTAFVAALGAITGLAARTDAPIIIPDAPNQNLEILLFPATPGGVFPPSALPFEGRVTAIGSLTLVDGPTVFITEDTLFVDGMLFLLRTGTVPLTFPDIGGDPIYGYTWVVDKENSVTNWQIQPFNQPTLDFNMDGVVNSNDFFDFLDAFFQGIGL